MHRDAPLLPTCHASFWAGRPSQLRQTAHPPPRPAGLLHRAVYVWVFRPDGALLVQRRSPAKRIGPSQLDLSVAEHLQPGEGYLQVGAARRGG